MESQGENENNFLRLGLEWVKGDERLDLEP